jgi:hypothetical protein
MREKVEFNRLELNKPHVFELDNADQGVETPGRWGDQYRYMFRGNQIAFLDPVIHQLICNTGAAPGDRIQFWRQETRAGTRKGPVQYRVDKLGYGEPEPPAAAAPADAFDAHVQATSPPATARPAAPITAPPAAAPIAASPRVEQATPAPPTSVLPAHTTMLASALVAAVDAAATAESYAEAHGRRVTFTSEDLRAFALSIYINLQGRRA